MCTRYPIINRVSELKVHIELTRFVQPEKIEIDANERAVNEKSPYCFFVCTTFDSFLNDLLNSPSLKLFINSASISTMVIIPNLGTITIYSPSHLLLLYIIPVLISNQSIGNKINNYFSHIWLIDIPLIIIF